MADIDPEAVMAAHSLAHDGLCARGYCDEPWPCEPYRLAETLAVEQARTSRVRALRDAASYSGTNRVYCSDISEALNPQDPTTPDPYLRSIDA